MLNYLKSEFYRVFIDKTIYVLAGCCLLIVLLLNGVLWYMANFTEGFPYATTKFAFSMLEGDMHVPLFLAALMGGVIVADELKLRTINNSVAFGCSRAQIYLSKIIVGIAASALCLIVTEAGLIASGYLLLENSDAAYTMSLLRGTAACIPAWIAGMTAAISLYYVSGSRSASIWSWLLIMVAVPSVVTLLGYKFAFCAKLASWLLYPMVSATSMGDEWIVYSWSTTAGFLKCQEAGIIGTSLFLALGIAAIRRREL